MASATRMEVDEEGTMRGEEGTVRGEGGTLRGNEIALEDKVTLLLFWKASTLSGKLFVLHNFFVM